MGPSRPEDLVEPEVPRNWARVAKDIGSTSRDLGHECDSPGNADQPAGNRTQARVVKDSWSTPRGTGHKCDSPRRAGRTRGHSYPAAGRPGQLVDPVGLWTWARVARDCWLNMQALGQEREWTGRTGRPRGAHGSGPKLPVTSGRTCWPSDPGPIRPGQLVDPTGTRTQVRVSRESWSTPRALGAGPKSPATSV